MAQYIDKDALVAEIEKIKTDALQKKSQCKRNGLERIMHQIGAYNKVLSFIDTLDVKEVDLDALGVLANHLIACNAHGVTPKYSDRELDFLEGLANNKAQKGEEV